jgi:hypothetical protein
MRMVTVELPEDLADAAEHFAAARGVSLDVLTAEALAARLARPVHRFGFVGIAASGQRTLSESYKAIRRAEFGS